MKVDLVVRFAPFEDEAPLGYYRRLAARNALLGWKELAQLTEVSVSRSGVLGRSEYMANALGLESSWTQSLFDREASARSWRGLLRGQHDAICPKCLSESPYLRAYWEHAYVTTCAKHETDLVDRCSSCLKIFSSNRAHIEYCQCGQDLRVMHAGNSAPSLIWLARLLQGHEGASGSIQPMLPEVDLQQLSKLVRNLCLLHDPHAVSPRRNSASPRTVEEAKEFLSPLEPLLANWPHGFAAHVQMRIASGDASSRTLNKLLGKWYLNIKALCAHGPMSEFLQVVVDVAANEYHGVIGLDGVTPSVSTGGFMLVSEAAQLMKLGRSTLMAAVLRSEILHRKKKFGARGYLYEVAESEIARVTAQRSLWLSEEQACARLDVSPAVLRHIVDADVLTVDVHWRSDICKSGPYLMSSVETFARQLSLNVEKRNHFGERVSLQELSARRIGDRSAIRKVIRAMFDGEVHALAPSKTTGALQFDFEDIQSFFSGAIIDSGLSIQRLSELTGWKWESISHWIDAGLLGAKTAVLRGQPCRVVSPEQLLKFCQTYLPLADAARLIGTKSSFLTLQLGDLSIHGRKTLPNGSHRGGLLLMSDVVRLSLGGMRNTLAEGVPDKQSPNH
jgi:hypothetical protein